MNGDPVTIRPYQQGDEEQIVKLLGSTFASFRPYAHNLDYWRWKYQKGPAEKSIIYVAEHRSGIVGTDSRHPVYISIAGRKTLCEQRTDLAVHPDFRRQGLFKGMTERLKEASVAAGIELSYGVESNPMVMKQWEKAGALQPAHPVKNLMWIKNIDRYAEARPGYSILKKSVLKLMNAYARSGEAPSRQTRAAGGWTVETVRRFDDRADDFFATTACNYDFIIERNRDYLNWRYCDPGTGPYSVQLASGSEGMLGYIVLRLSGLTHDYGIGHIVDLLALPGRQDVAESLIAAALHYFEGAGANEVTSWMIANHPYNRLLQRRGFLDLRQNARFTFVLLGHDPEVVDALKSRGKGVYLVHGDFYWV